MYDVCGTCINNPNNQHSISNNPRTDFSCNLNPEFYNRFKYVCFDPDNRDPNFMHVCDFYKCAKRIRYYYAGNNIDCCDNDINYGLY